ncbi:MAG: ABC transporter permease subunit, partial [Sphingomonadaceae bacterium]
PLRLAQLVPLHAHHSLRSIAKTCKSAIKPLGNPECRSALGPFGGVLALALADIPNLAKQFAESLENCDRAPVEGVRAAGAPPLMVVRYGLLPQIAPIWTSQSLYCLEGNFRNAGVLGIVAAGGIGYELEERMRVFAYDEALFIILLFMISVAFLDSISAKIRAHLA